MRALLARPSARASPHLERGDRMAGTVEAVREQDAVERLSVDEAKLEEEIATARRDAAARLEKARLEAEAIASEARRACAREIEALRARFAEELERTRDA